MHGLDDVGVAALIRRNEDGVVRDDLDLLDIPLRTVERLAQRFLVYQVTFVPVFGELINAIILEAVRVIVHVFLHRPCHVLV